MKKIHLFMLCIAYSAGAFFPPSAFAVIYLDENFETGTPFEDQNFPSFPRQIIRADEAVMPRSNDDAIVHLDDLPFTWFSGQSCEPWHCQSSTVEPHAPPDVPAGDHLRHWL